jgi:3-methyladenine DNA glycosylase Tag
MMNVFKKLYKDFFGIKEQTNASSAIPKFTKDDVQNAKDMAAAMLSMKNALKMEAEIDEARLVNNITDYRGGVEYVLRDPADAQSVAQEIADWTSRKGFTVVSKKISKTGKVGYFYFRLGQDPALESQKIQGYLAQKPEIKHFRFNVRQAAAPTPQRPQGPQGKI